MAVQLQLSFSLSFCQISHGFVIGGRLDRQTDMLAWVVHRTAAGEYVGMGSTLATPFFFEVLSPPFSSRSLTL